MTGQQSRRIPRRRRAAARTALLGLGTCRPRRPGGRPPVQPRLVAAQCAAVPSQHRLSEGLRMRTSGRRKRARKCWEAGTDELSFLLGSLGGLAIERHQYFELNISFRSGMKFLALDRVAHVYK